MHKRALPKSYNPKEVEENIYEKWISSGYFNPDNLPSRSKKTFTIAIPPPNITGALHMGHALNSTIQDILIRKKRMEGLKTLWIPGIDHAGIATQNVVEKKLRKEKKARHDLGREKFIAEIWKWKEEYGEIILDQFKKLGASADWSRTRFTMDENYQKAVAEAFIHYYKKGWIYEGERVISWCPKCQTSLSDLELEYKEEDGTLWHIKYKVKGGGHITIATVRPETMLGDSAIAVNPKDERYKKYIGKTAILPIQNREIPIISDKRVEKDFGTGALKITPAHDMLDAEIGKDHGLPAPKVINEYGKMMRSAGKICEGLKAKDCREKVVNELKKLGLLKKTGPYKHNIGKCYRCDTTIEPIPSRQWFLKMDKLAEFAKKSIKDKKVEIIPKNFEKPYLDWIKNIKDWTISRQIWWGHRLPVWRHENKCVPKKGKEHLVDKCEEVVVSEKKPECKYCDAEYKQVDDVLDTWFSSALWPFAILGWPEKTKDLKNFYPTQFLSTARDIINLWVSRMIFSSLEFTKKVPFKDVYIHATILTKDGKRMSKSLGTGVDPLDLIEKYSRDATRFALIWQAMGTQDIHWTEDALIAGKKFLNKIWNASRFVLMNVPASKHFDQTAPRPKKDVNKKILNEFKDTLKKYEKEIERYEFGHALHTIYDFFWHVFCDEYIEETKNNDDYETKETLVFILSSSIKAMHPILPHITEKVWEYLPLKNKKLLIIEEWPKF